MQHPYSFYVVFNPLLNGENENYKTQAHEFFHRLRERIASGDPSSSHLYWGKLKVSRHDDALDFDGFKKAHEANSMSGRPTHLFISDFHHFWVAKVESVHQEVFDKENTLPFYDGREVEIWFKITDMDLVSSEYTETGYYLQQLYAKNQFSRQELDSINPYLNGLRYPLIVQDRLCEDYFTGSKAYQGPRALGHNPLIENPSESGKVACTVQTYVLPPAIYGKLSERVKKCLIGIEMQIYKQDKEREGLSKNIASSYFNILDEIVNDTLGKFLNFEAPGEFFEKDKRPSIGKLMEVIKAHHERLSARFPEKAGFFEYCAIDLAKTLEEKNFSEMSDKEVSHKDAMLMRNLILGVGCKGIVNSMVCLFHEDEFMDSYFRKAA